ncbi:hypothetical protein N7456_001301 [Penicillium angulare]|uniref:Uncharacterized protein n=1 Tax=Penicillium angulare TaxID=116970 RepID=A0A9W9GDM7_9EURO|nr:hypothetical protein N7456_001301 [Penicillium angulare]
MSPISGPLEALPPELRRHLLTMMEFNVLKALVHASPVYHEQYLLDRQWLLGQCVEKLLGCVNIEASLVCQSSTASFAQTRTRESITLVLESYKHLQGLANFSFIEESLPLDDIIWILLFHTSIVVPLANRYSAWALDNLAKKDEVNEANSSLVDASDSLSQSEETRIIRALYRLQLWCNLFGIGPHKEIDKPFYSGYSSIDLLTIHASHFEPWEIEEMHCVYLYSETIYRQIFDQIHWDVNERNPKFDAIRKDDDPEGSFDLDSNANTVAEDGFLNGMVTQGLELLHTITCRVTDHSELVLIMQDKLCLHTGLLAGDDLKGMGAEEERRRCAPSDQDLKEKEREPLPFQGDRIDGVYPPLAWTLLWGGTYSSITGDSLWDFMGGNGLRTWGYVMWDKERLEYMGAIEVLAKQIKEDSWLEDGDPRTSMGYGVEFGI